MSSLPWERDHALTHETAAGIIAACFPSIDSSELQPIGSGWEFDAFLTSDGWVFRFPRRAESATLFESERRVLELVAPALPAHVAVPRTERKGPPTLGFPYPIAGHRFIPGIPVDAVPTQFLPSIAREIAAVLGAIHSIPEHRARAEGILEMDVNEEGRHEWGKRGIAAAERLHGLDPVVDQALRWLSEEALLPMVPGGPLCLIHHDLSPEHILVNPTTGALSGVLDWTDAILGDAARDLVFLATWQGWPFVELVLRNYPRTVDGEFPQRLRSMARSLSLMWLAFAHEQGSDLTSHIQAVRNVFAGLSVRSGSLTSPRING